MKKSSVFIILAVLTGSVVFFSSYVDIQNKKTDPDYSVVFTELLTGSNSSIRAISVVNESVVWASGSKGTFLLSTDGGKTWKCDTIPFESKNDFRSIHAWDDKKAIVFGTGYPGKAYITHDGGSSWTKLYENNTNGIFFNSLKFSDKDNGIAVSDPFDDRSFVIKTSDSGRKWKRLENIPPVIKGEGNFAASNSCVDYRSSGRAWIITGGTAARVFYTINDGADWKVTEPPIIHNTASSGIFSVSFFNDFNGIIVGGTYDKMELNDNIAAYSSDGGVTWSASEKMPYGFRSCVIWLKHKKNIIAFSVGPTGSDYSTDYGKTWIHSGEEGFHTMMAVKGKSSGFAAGSGGRIAKFSLEKKMN